jgi:protein SHQ1
LEEEGAKSTSPIDTNNVVIEGRERASYDINTGNLVIYLPKLNRGEFFPDLDMLTKLMEKKKNNNSPVIETISNIQEENEDDELDWEFDQKIPTEEETNLTGVKYGFNNQYSQYLEPYLSEELDEIILLKDPEHSNIIERNNQRIQTENIKFDEEHYM